MFNLEQAILSWRAQMRAGGMRSSKVLDELESHLREEVEQQTSLGLSEAQAFAAAVLRMGSIGVLKTEFAKLRGTVELWRRKFIFICGILPADVFAIISGVGFLSSGLSLVEQVLGLAMSGLVALYICSLAFFHSGLSGIPDQRARLLYQMACTFAWLSGGVAILIFGLPRLGLPNDSVAITLYSVLAVVPVLVWLPRASGAAGGSQPPSVGSHPPLFGPIPPTRPLPPGWTLAAHALDSLDLAYAEAQRCHHDYIGTEHVLLGLLNAQPSSVTRVLHRLGLEPELVRDEINKFVVNGSSGASPQLPYTPRAQRALGLAVKEAARLNQALVEAEHVLLGLLREGSGVAALALKNLGVRVETVRDEMLKTASTAT